MRFRDIGNMKYSIIALAILATIVIYSCNDDDGLGPVILEPITFLQPDTPTVWGLPGSMVDLETQLTTDRIIDSLTIKFHIDSLNQGYDPDTDPLFNYQVVKWPVDNNIQTYLGNYTIPGDLQSFDVVRLIFILRAKERVYRKTLKINVQ